MGKGNIRHLLPGDDQIDRIVDSILAFTDVSATTDKYFTHSSDIARKYGDAEVTYAVFMRRRIVAAFGPALRLVEKLVPEATIKRYFSEGELVPSDSKLFTVTGPYTALSEVETLMLQKVGFPCVAAYNAFNMCRALPQSQFMDMHARHASGAEMNLLVAYGAAVGSAAAKARDRRVTGFIGSSQDITASLFGQEAGLGTMPHALVGYAQGDVLEATKMFSRALPDAPAVVSLVDFNGKEITDALRCAEWFYNESGLVKAGKIFGVRLDTHGGRFAEELNYAKSVEVVGAWLDVDGEYNIVEEALGQRAFQLDAGDVIIDQVRRTLFGNGVSVASIINTRNRLDEAGFDSVRIIASSGFDPQKCLVMGAAKAPIDMVGTGSYMPSTLRETYSTADIIAYDGVKRVKLGREFLYD